MTRHISRLGEGTSIKSSRVKLLLWSQTSPLKQITGADPGFQVRGCALKFAFGVFRVKNHDFTPKNHIFSNFPDLRPLSATTVIATERSKIYVSLLATCFCFNLCTTVSILIYEFARRGSGRNSLFGEALEGTVCSERLWKEKFVRRGSGRNSLFGEALEGKV